MNYDAILLTSFGGPEGPDEVAPFLERVTAGRGVPRERLKEVEDHYLACGGVSPINAQNRALQVEMRKSFAARGIDLPIYLGNRNSPPYYADVLKEMYKMGHRKVLALFTSAYSSYSGCRQYRENLASALIETELTGKIEIHKIRPYFDHPGFIEPFADGLVGALKKIKAQGIGIAATQILFTTHSIPNSMAQTSGPPTHHGEVFAGVYIAQHESTATLVIAAATKILGNELPSWELVYQSRSGRPTVPWLEPDIGDAIRSAASAGSKAVIVIPIGFISDHMEVIWDLDTEAKEIADECGLVFHRVSTPGVASQFIEGISDLVEECIKAAEDKSLAKLGSRPDFCAVGCCPNTRADLPAIS